MVRKAVDALDIAQDKHIAIAVRNHNRRTLRRDAVQCLYVLKNDEIFLTAKMTPES